MLELIHFEAHLFAPLRYNSIRMNEFNAIQQFQFGTFVRRKYHHVRCCLKQLPQQRV